MDEKSAEMPSVFVSHSSLDNSHAAEIERWLRSQGHEDIFLDFHKDDGISAGVNWKGALAAAMQRCHVVLALISDHWFASAWCQAEQAAATMLGKQVIPVVVSLDDAERRSVLIAALQQRFGDIQVADLTGDREAGLARLAASLGVSTVTPMAFPVPEGAAPYRGLSAFGPAEQGLYFGREVEVQSCLEQLRRMADAEGGRRMLAILGASGAGKSSLLRAGLLPQLQLRSREFIALDPVTLARDPFGQRSAARAIEQALADAFRSAGVRFDRSALDAALGPLDAAPAAVGAATAAYAGVLDALRRTRGALDARVVLSLDQAEALLQVSDDERTALLRRLQAFVEAPGAVIVVVMRSDSFGTVLERRLFERFELALFGLPPIPISRLGDVIRGPARRVGLRVDDALIDTAIADAGGGDALPLLSVTFEGLWRRHGASGHLTLAQYEERSGLQDGRRVSPVDNSVRLAADEAVGSLDAAEHQALVEAFIPGLVDLSDSGTFVRRRGSWEGLPDAAARPLKRLEEARLLSSGEGGSLEVTHEALLRRWPMLAERLEQSRGDLRLLKDIERCAAEWIQGGRDSTDLRHAQGRLRKAQTLARRPAWARRLGPQGRSYLEACAGNASTSRRRIAAAAACILLATASVLAYTRSNDFAWRRLLADAPGAAQQWKWPAGRLAVLARAGLDDQLATEWKASAAAPSGRRAGEMCDAVTASLEAGRVSSARAALKLLFDERMATDLGNEDRRFGSDLRGLGAHCLDLAFPLGMGGLAMAPLRQAVNIERPDGFYVQGEAVLLLLRAGFVMDANDAQFDELLGLAAGHPHPRWGLTALTIWLPLASDVRGKRIASAFEDWAGRHPAMLCGRGRIESRVDSGHVDDFSVLDAIQALRESGYEAQAAALVPFVCKERVPVAAPSTAVAAPAGRVAWLRWAAYDAQAATQPTQAQGRCEALWALVRREPFAPPAGIEGVVALARGLPKSACDTLFDRELARDVGGLAVTGDAQPPFSRVQRVRAVLAADILGPQTAAALYWASVRLLMAGRGEHLPLAEVELAHAARHGAPVHWPARAGTPDLYAVWSGQNARDPSPRAPACEALDPVTVQWLRGAGDEARRMLREASAAWEAAGRPGATSRGNPRACLTLALSAVHDFDAAVTMALAEPTALVRDGLFATIAMARALGGDLRGARETARLSSSLDARDVLQTRLLDAWQWRQVLERDRPASR